MRYCGWVRDRRVRRKGGVPEVSTENTACSTAQRAELPEPASRQTASPDMAPRSERRARAYGLSSPFFNPVSFPPKISEMLTAHAALKTGWMDSFLTIVSSHNPYISTSSSFELPLTCFCRIFYLTSVKTTEKL